MKKWICLLMGVIFMLSATGCKRIITDDFDPNKTYIRVAYFAGGVVPDWLLELEKEYEALHKDVDIVINANEKDTLRDENLVNTIANRAEDIFFTHTLRYQVYVKRDLIADISDVVENPAAEGEKSVKERMNPILRDYYTYTDKKFYAVPFYDNFYGAVYDVDLFEEKKLYFAEDGSWTDGKIKPKSLGKDGVVSSDDGLPVTYADFKKLMEHMKYEASVTPFIWCATDSAYRTDYLKSVWTGNEGAEDFMLNYKLEGTDRHGNTFDLKGADDVLLNCDGRKYSIDLCHEIIDKGYFYSESMNGIMNNLEAQETFLRSRPDGKPIAMIMEGGWWEKEALAVFNSISKGNPESEYAYGNRRFAYMPVPMYNDDSFNSPAYYSSSGTTTAIINANTKNIDVAKDFLKFTLTEHAMSTFTKYTGVVRPYDYELEEGVFESLSPFSQDFWTIYRNEKTEVAYDLTFNQIRRDLGAYITPWFFGSKIGNTKYEDPYFAFENNKSLTWQQYFEGAKILFADYDEQVDKWLSSQN